MSSDDDVLSSSSLVLVQDNTKLWEERYREKDQENEELDAKYRDLELENQALRVKCSRLEKYTNEDPEHPAKRTKLDDCTMDPFVKLEEPIAHKIMKYLSGMELLQAIEVSQGWMRFIEERPSLINQAMDQVVVKPSLKGWSIPLINWTFFENSRKIRPYRHMKSPVWIRFKSKIFSVADYASTLETLTVPENYPCPDCYHNADDYKIAENLIEACEFPKLQKLIINQDDAIFFFKDCSFPAVTELKFELDGYATYKSMRAIIKNFPQLKSLAIPHYEFSDQKDPIQIEADDQQPKGIESISLGTYNSELMKDHKHSLQHLEIDGIEPFQMQWLLRDLKVLKTFKLRVLDVGDESGFDFIQNSSIEYFKISDVMLKGSYRFLSDAQILHWLTSIFIALPSLKVFELSCTSALKITPELLRLIASHLPKLKEFLYNSIHRFNEVMAQGAIEAYQDIRINSHLYLNSSFVLVDIAPCVGYQSL